LPWSRDQARRGVFDPGFPMFAFWKADSGVGACPAIKSSVTLILCLTYKVRVPPIQGGGMFLGGVFPGLHPGL
jgi:hypothetical protein